MSPEGLEGVGSHTFVPQVLLLIWVGAWSEHPTLSDPRACCYKAHLYGSRGGQRPLSVY